MRCAQMLKNPLIVAVFSSLIGVVFTLSGTHLYDSWKHNERRASGLRVLRNQLQNHQKQLNDLDNNLGKNLIYGTLDPSSIIHFLNSNIMDLSKDEKLITALYEHLDNIELIKRSLDLISMRSAGWTSVHREEKEGLEQNLKKYIPECLLKLELCLKELLK